MRLVLFDVDGTLIDSQALIHECMRRTFAKFGHEEPDLSQVRRIIGLSLDHAIALLVGDTQADIAGLSAHYKQTWLSLQGAPEHASKFFPGMKELVASLSARDEIVLGIVTGKSRRGLARLIETHGLEGTFLTTRTADDCPSKPHPAMVLECCAETGIGPADAIVIGDTGYDIEMARSAGARAIGVGWGYHPRDELERAGAAAIADVAADIIPLLETAWLDDTDDAGIS